MEIIKPSVVGWAISLTEREEGKTEPDTLDEAIAQTVGAASMCWHPNGVFDSAKAEALIEMLKGWIERNYTPLVRVEDVRRGAPEFDE